MAPGRLVDLAVSDREIKYVGVVMTVLVGRWCTRGKHADWMRCGHETHARLRADGRSSAGAACHAIGPHRCTAVVLGERRAG
jgi:hypothetical protein